MKNNQVVFERGKKCFAFDRFVKPAEKIRQPDKKTIEKAVEKSRSDGFARKNQPQPETY